MKTPVWTASDIDRSKKMGWRLETQESAQLQSQVLRIKRHGDRFKSDDEAIEWVIEVVESLPLELVENEQLYKTCRKALFLCAKG